MAPLPPETLTIVVPIYRPAVDDLEALSLDSTFRVLGGHHLVLVKPEGLDTSALERRYRFAAVETFHASYFGTLRGYNRLLLSTEFYERFLRSRYLLVCQLDVFVFRDDLARWIDRGYDYVGAPWVSGSAASLELQRLKMRVARLVGAGRGRIHPYEMRNRVGNGGFSLRAVATHHRLSVELREAIDHYVANQGSHHFHEDVFWSLEPSRRGLPHRTPSAEEAMAFSWDVHPERLWALSGGRLPMAAHGWFKRRQRAFWEPHVAATLAALPGAPAAAAPGRSTPP